MPVIKFLARNLFHPISLWRAGELAQMRYLSEFERTQFLSADELFLLQWDRLREQLAHAYDQCPFYRERFEEAGLTPCRVQTPDDLRRLRPLEKRDIQERRDEMIARDWPRDDLLFNQTGGSTGTPVTFFGSRDRKASRAAATLRHNRWAGWEPGDRAAVIWGAARDRPEETWRSRLRHHLLRDPLWLDAAQLTESAMEHFHAELWRYRPKTIQAYARAAVLFARFLISRGLQAYRPHSLITSGEVLEDEDRLLLEDVFDCPVFNRYGCREVSVIASECEQHQGLHVMAETLYVEIESPAPGEPGGILITDLLNRAMPLIRYRTGDVGEWQPGPCPCGRGLPRLRHVHGRVSEFLVGTTGQLVSGLAMANFVVAHRPSLGQVQIWQDRPGAVRYRIKPGRDFDAIEDVNYLWQATRRYLGEGATVEWDLVDDLPSEASGKFLFSRSTVAASFLTGNTSG